MISKTNFKMRLLVIALSLIAVLTSIPVSTVHASFYTDDCLAQTINNRHTVYASASTATYKGQLFAGETFTILESTGDFYHIEYSTSSGTKEGYVKHSSDIAIYTTSTYVSNVRSTSTVYFGPNSSSYETVGTVYAGENVVVLAVGDSWNMIEYNSPSGRKRGYVPQSSLTWGNRRFKDMSGLPVFSERNSQYVYVSSTTNVKAGPTQQFPTIGSVNSNDNPIIYANIAGGYYYVRYKVDSSGKYKTGYIKL